MIHEKNLPEVLFHSYFLKVSDPFGKSFPGNGKVHKIEHGDVMLFPKRRLFVVNSQRNPHLMIVK